MTQIASPPFQAGQFVGESPASGIVAAVASDGTVKVLTAWDPVQGDVTYTAAAGSAGGGGTRRHLFGTAVAMSLTLGVTGVITASSGIVSTVFSNGTATYLSVGAGATPTVSFPSSGAASFGGAVAAAGAISVTGGTAVTGSISKNAADGFTIVATTGSANDFSLYNPAIGVNIIRVPVGTTTVSFAGAVVVTGGTAVAGSVTKNATDGFAIVGVAGSANDLTLYNGAIQLVMRVPTTTTRVIFADRISATLPTSSAGLVAGDLWRNGTVVNII